MNRPSLEQFDGEAYDVVVIGAGAVGCATARELAGRGYLTLLVDRGDIGAGTSSRSSRMLYSGLGYLAVRYPLWQMPFRPADALQRLRYTRAVMMCRAELVREMPDHLTKHRFHYPFRAGDRYPPWLVDMGFRLVEALGGWKVPLSYRRLSPERARGESALAAGLVGGPLRAVGMFEEYMYAWPERICVDTALDAERRGATIRTYAQVTGIGRDGDDWAVTLDERAPEAEGRARIKGRMVVNAAGPWIDRVPGGGAGPKRVIGVKGVNVMVRLPETYRGQGLEAFSSRNEPFYVFPWGEHHFIGPTETVVTENPDDVRVQDTEIDYLLGEANRLFPDLGLGREHVLHCWCGVRPTSTLDGATTSLPVRVAEDNRTPGLVAVTGATIMLHRHAGHRTAEAVERRLGKRDSPPRGVIAAPENRPNDERIGRMAADEHVVRLADLIRRRLPDGLNPALGRDRAEELSRIAAASLGWSEARRQEELRHFDHDTATVYRQTGL